MRFKGMPRPSIRPRFCYLIVAILAGLILYSTTFISSTYNPFARHLPTKHIQGYEAGLPTPTSEGTSFHDNIVHANAVDLQFDAGNVLLELSETELADMVSRTKGYLVRDWSLSLGWNNVRYIIETSLHHAHLMNRTLVLPSFVLARACEYHIDVCARYARTVNRNDALGSEEWRHLPLEQQQAFLIPLQFMMDIAYLRQRNHSVVLLSEYLLLQGLNRSRELSSGSWDRHYYHEGADQPSLFVIPNGSYDPLGVVRVNKLPAPRDGIAEENLFSPDLGRLCNATLSKLGVEKGRSVLEWSEVQQGLRSITDVENENTLQRLLQDAGWATLHTWQGAIGMDFAKDVVKPIRRLAPYKTLRGFVEDYAQLEHDVVLLEGEIHLGRKPGSLYFTSIKERDNFATIVLRDIRPSKEVRNLAKRLVERMHRLSRGRHWAAAHMRRGDFVAAGWINESTLKDHLKRVMTRLEAGRQLLERIVGSPPERYDVPVTTISRLPYQKPPLKSDPIYLATDERSSEGLALFKEYNIKMFGDLVTINDRRLFGWPLLYTDVIALVEQQMIGTGAAYFYAHGMSSVAGGIMNVRAASGWDARTAMLDY